MKKNNLKTDYVFLDRLATKVNRSRHQILDLLGIMNFKLWVYLDMEEKLHHRNNMDLTPGTRAEVINVLTLKDGTFDLNWNLDEFRNVVY